MDVILSHDKTQNRNKCSNLQITACEVLNLYYISFVHFDKSFIIDLHYALKIDFVSFEIKALDFSEQVHSCMGNQFALWMSFRQTCVQSKYMSTANPSSFIAWWETRDAICERKDLFWKFSLLQVIRAYSVTWTLLLTFLFSLLSSIKLSDNDFVDNPRETIDRSKLPADSGRPFFFTLLADCEFYSVHDAVGKSRVIRSLVLCLLWGATENIDASINKSNAIPIFQWTLQ